MGDQLSSLCPFLDTYYLIWPVESPLRFRVAFTIIFCILSPLLICFLRYLFSFSSFFMRSFRFDASNEVMKFPILTASLFPIRMASLEERNRLSCLLPHCACCYHISESVRVYHRLGRGGG